MDFYFRLGSQQGSLPLIVKSDIKLTSAPKPTANCRTQQSVSKPEPTNCIKDWAATTKVKRNHSQAFYLQIDFRFVDGPIRLSAKREILLLYSPINATNSTLGNSCNKEIMAQKNKRKKETNHLQNVMRLSFTEAIIFSNLFAGALHSCLQSTEKLSSKASPSVTPLLVS